MITIKKLRPADIEAVKSIELASEQVCFAGTAQEFLEEICETTHLHVIYHQDTLVGYFKLDLAYAEKFAYCPTGALGIRAFVIGQQYQGKGLGSAAMVAVLGYLAEHYAQFRWLYLGVNCQNPGAYACYKKAGLTECEDKYLGGPAGPQYIMYSEIKQN
ncbi:GNAT family N-acetyltransferase [Pseudoalteromonas rubra]|uniref:GNAT family N-acetyltransferase n=1 Tax=Pseudoalteromonas rubra TaxID=43658 RepID=A0A5S3USI7_9GAMM|nr:GNAT family N-acetyltransferase [Pseudoalteromonas rubra]QPB85579.1 GNAT family N-acetyltransferase [Pseudoalteromonas rubra]